MSAEGVAHEAYIVLAEVDLAKLERELEGACRTLQSAQSERRQLVRQNRGAPSSGLLTNSTANRITEAEIAEADASRDLPEPDAPGDGGDPCPEGRLRREAISSRSVPRRGRTSCSSTSPKRVRPGSSLAPRGGRNGPRARDEGHGPLGGRSREAVLRLGRGRHERRLDRAPPAAARAAVPRDRRERRARIELP
ncbi:MAG: hypothetical protein R2862_04260 [Thermoanaerobaculia bacterium]